MSHRFGTGFNENFALQFLKQNVQCTILCLHYKISANHVTRGEFYDG